MENLCPVRNLRFGSNLLLAGCRSSDSADLRQDFLLAEDQVFLLIDGDVIGGVFAEQNPVAHLHIKRDTMALFDLAGSDSHHLALLRLFFSRVGDNDSTLRSFFLFQPAYEYAVMKRSDIYSNFFSLRFIHSKNSNSQLFEILGQRYGRKIFRFFCRATCRLSVFACTLHALIQAAADRARSPTGRSLASKRNALSWICRE